MGGPPDAELLDLADSGRLLDPKVLDAQLARLLADPGAIRFGRSFAGQWLGTRQLGTGVEPDPIDVAFMTDSVMADMRDEVARFLDRLAALPEGAGTLLDHSVVVYGSSISDGHEHGESNLPVLVIGGGGGAIRGGRVLDHEGETSLSPLHLATLHVLGLPAGRFAETDSPLDLA